VDRAKPLADGASGKLWPKLAEVGEFEIDNWLSCAVAVHARTLMRLQLKQLKGPHRFARRRDDLKLAVRRRDHHARSVNIQRLDASDAEKTQEINDVKILDEAVGERHEGSHHKSFIQHGNPTLTTTVGQATRRPADPTATAPGRSPLRYGPAKSGAPDRMSRVSEPL
jgi:hypothetical protein